MASSLYPSNWSAKRASPQVRENDRIHSRQSKRVRREPTDSNDHSVPTCSTSDRSRPTSSTSSSGIDAEKWYGYGDDEALYNIFGTYLPAHFSTVPRPHGSQGMDEPWWQLRNDSEIYLSNDFPYPGRGGQRVTQPIPGPEPSDRRQARHDAHLERRERESRLRGLDTKFCTAGDLWRTENQGSGTPSTSSSQSSPKSITRERTTTTRETRRSRDGSTTSHERTVTDRVTWSRSPTHSDRSRSKSPGSQLRQEQEEQEQYLDTRSSPSQPETIPTLPIPGALEPTFEALFTRVNTFAKDNGFGVVKRQAKSRQGRLQRYTLECDRYGEPRQSRGAGLRQRQSRKCGCKWKIFAVSLPENNHQWTLRQLPDILHFIHNHPPSTDSSAHPSHRKLTDAIKTTVESTSRRVGIRARDVRSVVEQQHPDSVLTRRDIYNARARVNREKLGGYNPTAALIKLFDEQGISYIVKWSDNEPTRLVGLVWTFPYCINMWKRFPEVFGFDNTYNTNRFKLPLFQVTGQTCLGTIFNAAFGLIDNERLEGFQFLADAIQQLATKNDIRSPDVIITDFDIQMKKALNEQLPDSQQQLCIHHIISNVLLKSKQKWITLHLGTDSNSDYDQDGNEEAGASIRVTASDRAIAKISASEDSSKPVPHSYEGVVVLWKLLMFAETEAEHNAAWARICREFEDQRAILSYLYRTYMPVREQWARCFIRGYRNFGCRVTSGTEASNNNVKSYLLNGMSNLYRLVEAIKDMLNDQEKDFRQACANDEVLTRPEHIGRGAEYLGELPQVVSQKALGLITHEYRRALKAIPTASNIRPETLGACTDDCSVSFELGIPCRHRILSKLEDNTPLTKWDVHPRWHLRQSTSTDPYRRILDPKIATSLRGRPKNIAQPVPSRLAIERVVAQSQSQQEHRPEVSQLQEPQGSQPRRGRGRPRGSKNRTTLARQAQEAAQELPTHTGSGTRSRSARLGAGNTTGVRASGRRVQPSVRRRRSKWEL
jgi:hypothetical protein